MMSHHLAADLAAEISRDRLAAADAARLARKAKQARQASAAETAAASSQPARRWSLRRRPAPC